MKRLLVILIFTSIYFIFGCTETGQVAGPENTSDAVSSGSEIGKRSIPVSEINWLPKTTNQKSLSKKITTSKMISVKRNGFIKLEIEEPGDIFKWYGVYTKIKFDRKTITKDSFYADEEYVFSSDGRKVEITLELDNESHMVTFSPHLMFNKPAKLDFEIWGYDFGEVDPANIEFVYIPEGSEDAFFPKYRSKKFDRDEGWLEFRGLKIPHFSRFGLTD